MHRADVDDLAGPLSGTAPLSNRQVFDGVVFDGVVFDGVVYVLHTGCQWKSLKMDWFGAASSIHARFQAWERQGIWARIFKHMLKRYDQIRGIRWRWQALDSKSVPAPRGGDKTGKNLTDRGKLGSKWHVLVDQRGAPLSITISAANTHDKRRAVTTLKACPLPKPDRVYRVHHLCADKGYDALDIGVAVDTLHYRAHIARRGQAPVARPKRYPARRWVVERTHSWHTHFRSLRVRWSKKSDNWLVLHHLAAAFTLCRLSFYG